MESHDTARESSSQMLDTVRQVLALMITSYPVVVPLLEELKESFRDGLERIGESLPRIQQILAELPMDYEAAENFTQKLVDVLPELETLFRKMED
ncbi:MAG: hypothetical protein QM372_11170 [Bacillota bacterium]|nr:hypothetical protein [Bacillota bacterium]NLJ02006.1 hypothetical protein [Bacillota bacterium]